MKLVCAILYLAFELFAGASQTADLVFYDLHDIPRRPLQPNQKSGTVLLFYWHDCPICNSYAPELRRISGSYTNFSFYIVQVDPDLTRPMAKKHASEYDLPAPVLLDPQHHLVQWAKATVTPEAVVIGANGQVRYQGRIDNLYAGLGKKRNTATQHDLREALDAISLNKPIRTKRTKAIGCLIQDPK
jgi:hypothetical protein